MFISRPAQNISGPSMDSVSPLRQLPMKTPKSKMSNNQLRSTMKENTTLHHTLLKTGKGKGKNVFPSTPHVKESVEPQNHWFEEHVQNSMKKAAATTRMAPLIELTNVNANKTPFPNRVQKQSSPSKARQLLVFVEADVPQTAVRPSRSRNSLRMPGSAIRDFKTPEPSGKKHWEISQGDISVEAAPAVESEVVAECDDDIEYMPPTALDLAYEPDFDMPDYKDVGKMVWEISKLPALSTFCTPRHMYDSEPVGLIEAGGGLKAMSADPVVLCELEDDDPFLSHKQMMFMKSLKNAPQRLPSKATASRPNPILKSASAKPVIRTVLPKITKTNASVPPRRVPAPAPSRETLLPTRPKTITKATAPISKPVAAPTRPTTIKSKVPTPRIPASINRLAPRAIPNTKKPISKSVSTATSDEDVLVAALMVPQAVFADEFAF